MKRIFLLCVLTVGCAAQKAERAPASSAPPPSSDHDGTGTSGGDVTKPSTAPMPGSAGGASPTLVGPDEVTKAQGSFDDASKAFSAAGSDCAQLCKALHSMTHATDRLCELTQSGPASDQQRCTDARARLETAKSKVSSSCGSC